MRAICGRAESAGDFRAHGDSLLPPVSCAAGAAVLSDGHAGNSFSGLPAREEGVNQDDWYLTQAGRIRVMGEVRRLGDQIVPQFEELCQYSGMKRKVNSL